MDPNANKHPNLYAHSDSDHHSIANLHTHLNTQHHAFSNHHTNADFCFSDGDRQ